MRQQPSNHVSVNVHQTHKVPLGLLNLKGRDTKFLWLDSWQPRCLCVSYLGQQPTASEVCTSKQEVMPRFRLHALSSAVETTGDVGFLLRRSLQHLFRPQACC